MALYRIRLELARTHEFPNGNPARGYEFVAPLDDQGHLDAEEWRAQKDHCYVHRFWEGEDDEKGHLAHVGRGWHFHYDGQPMDEDEPLFKLDRHALTQGDYVSVTDEDGELQPFRIVMVKPV